MLKPAEKIWDHERQRHNHKLKRAASVLGASLHDKVVPADMAVRLLEAVLEPGDRVCMEGNNQKQADFLAQALTRVDPARVNKLHMLQSVLALPEHLDLYELGIAEQLDFSFSGPQAAGDLSTRVELFYELMTCKKKKFTPVPFNHYK
jgi:malonate decarboxylase alpha subunit